MTIVKLKQLTLHNFMYFRHAEIKLLDDITLIDAMKQSPEDLANFVLAFKFILNNSNFSDDEVRRIYDANESINESIYVEAQFSSHASEMNYIFRKALNNYEITYEVNHNLTTREDFKARLTQLGFEFSSSNTLLIDPQVINRIAIMNDKSRGEYIEQFCASPELLARYQRNKDKMESIQVEMKSLVDQKKQLKASEKSEKTKINSMRSFKELDRELQNVTQESLLFQLYHNQRYFELSPKKIEDLKEALNAIKGDYENFLMTFKIATENYLMYARFFIESNGKVRDSYNETIQLQQDYVKNFQEVLLLELQSSENFENRYLRSIKEELTKNKSKMIEFQMLKAELDLSYDEYQQLRETFNIQNLEDMTHVNTLKKLIISDIYEMEESQKFLQIQLHDLKKEDEHYASKINALKDGQAAIEEDLDDHSTYAKELETRYKAKKLLIAKFENAISSFPGTKLSNARIVLEKLKSKFSHAIVGRLSDLFDVKAVNGIEVKRFQILERLGKFAEAIVVDSQEVADHCVQFLKLQQHQSINEVILPLTISKEASTIEAIKNYKFPEGIKVEPIENFINAKHPEILKLLMHILKPTLVCESRIDVLNIFDYVDKRLQVTSFESASTHKPGGIIQIHLRHVEADFDDETLLMIYKNLQECYLEVIETNADIKINDLKLAGFENKKRTYEYYARMFASLKESNLETMTFLLKKINDGTEIINRLKNINGLDKLMKKYEEMKENMRTKEADFFKAFLEKHDYQTIDDYELELSKVHPEKAYQTRLSFFAARHEFYEKIKTKILLFAPLNEAEDLENSKERLNKTKELLEKSKESFEKIMKEKTTINETMTESLKSCMEKRAEFNDLEKKVETMTEKLCDEFINIQIAIAENCRLLFFALADCDKVPLKEGSLMKLLDVPSSDEMTEDFDLFQRNLDGLEIDLEKLDDKLKSELDIPKKKIEMSKKLEQLKVSLDAFALDVTGDKEHLLYLTERLNRLLAETRKLTDDYQDVMKEFQSVGNERAQRFNECLKIINEEIGKFGAIAMRGKTHGELKAHSIDEPYASEITYTWRMGNQHEENVNDLHINYEAAFAFLMGLMKYKKQQFVLFGDSLKFMLNDSHAKSLLDYLKLDSNVQIVAIFASKIKYIEEHCSYSIMKREDRCIVKSNF